MSSRLNEQLAAFEYAGIELTEDEVISDVVLAARVTRMSDGRSTIVVAGNEGIDLVTRVGLFECARQATEAFAGWYGVDDDDD